MLDERQKKLAAAIIAVREGRLTATEAAALVKDPAASASAFFKGDGQRLDDPALLVAALQNAGVTEEETRLFSSGDDGKADVIVRKTLFNVAPTMPPADNSTERPSTTRLRRPSRITERERYSIKREFARGGQGRIMIARDNVVGREVALKELLPELQEQEGAGTPATAANETIGVVERFLREAKVTGQLEHPNVVPVYEIGRHENGSLYYTMKFVRGQTLAERLRDIDRLQLPREKKLALRLKLLEPFQGICNAVAFAHSRGVIHRDLKPQNIMIGDFGETVLLDWGLARVKGQDDKIGKQITMVATNMLSESLLAQKADGLTVDGTVFGTPHYMPPEQARADLREIDEQSDVYSLGAILYELLTGAPPYDGPTAGFILQQVMSGPPRKIKEREPHAPPDLVALCEYAMAHDKARRMKTAVQLASEIQAYRDGGQLKIYKYGAFEQARRAFSRHRGAVLAALLTFVLLLAGGALFFATIIGEKAEAEELQRAAEADRDKTSTALSQAREAREAQLELERREAQARRQRKQARDAEVKTLREAISGMRIEPLMKDLAARLAQYEDLEERGKAIAVSPPERTSNANLLMSLLGYFAAQDSLISLLNSPDEMLDADQRAEIKRQKQALAQARLLAARLATYNSDFAQAQLLLAASEADEDSMANARAAMARTREAMLKVQRESIAAALADCAQGLLREGRKGPTLSEYIEQLRGYREAQTVEMLAAALEPLARRAKAKDLAWNNADLETAMLGCGVLGKLEMPLEAVPHLLAFLDAKPPAPVSVACALALCDTRSPACALPLAKFARGHGRDSWPRIEAAYAQLPMPEQMRRDGELDTLLSRAVFLLAHGDSAGARDACSAAIALDADSAEARLWRGKAYARAGNTEKALEDFRMAITLAPGSAEPRIARGELFAASGRHIQANQDYATALASDGLNATALIRRGESRLAIFDYDGAASDFTRAIECDAWRLDAIVGQARVFEARRNINEAAAVFRRALALDPYYQEAWAAMGIMFRQNGWQRDAIAALTRALELDPRDWRCLSTRAQSYAVLQQWAEAVNDANAALLLDPNDVESLLVRAGTLIRLAENDTTRNRAIADLRRATALAPGESRAWIMLAETALALKLWQEAANAAARARVLAPFGALQQKISREQVWQMELDAQAALALDSDSADYATRVLKARGLANAGARQPQRLREACALAGALASDKALPQQQLPFLVAVLRKLATLLADGGFASDALAHASLLDALAQLGPEDAYLAARAAARLGSQQRDARVQFLGESDAGRAALENSANSKPQEQRDRQKAEAYARALSWLARAAKEGFADIARVSAEDGFTPLRGLPGWPDTLRQISAAAKDTALQQKIAARQPRLVVYITFVAPEGQAKSLNLKTQDVLARINEREIDTFNELRKVLGAQKENYRLTVHRYRLDAEGRLIQKTTEGKPAVDAQGLPVWDFDEIVLEAKPGQLGIRIEEGSIPREIIVP